MTKRSPGHIDNLKKENAQLESENARSRKGLSAKTQINGRHKLDAMYRAIVVLLVGLSVLVLIVGNLIFWASKTLVNSNGFASATQPIIKDPQVQRSIALYVNNKIFENINVEKQIESVLPPRTDFLAPELTSQIKSASQSTLEKTLANPSFQSKWNDLLKEQHRHFISYVSNYEGKGDISLNSIYNQLSASLTNTRRNFLAATSLPPRVGNIVIINASWLPVVHAIVANIHTWRYLTIILLAIMLTVAIWLSANRRRTIYVFSFVSAGALVITLIALRFLREQISGSVNPQYARGVDDVLRIFVHPLVAQTIVLLLALSVIGAITWLSGPSHGATAAKRKGSKLNSVLHSKIFSRDTSFNLWTRDHKRLLEWLVVGLLAIILLATQITLSTLITYLISMVILLLLIELVGGTPSDNASKPSNRSRQ